MKKIKQTVLSLLCVSIALPYHLDAQVIPGIDTKAGGTVVPKGKLVMAIKHIYFKRNHMFDGTHEVTNKEHLDAKANVTLLALRYGIAENMDIRLVMPVKQIEATAQLAPTASLSTIAV